jgi:glutathione S-transferase
MLLSFPLNRIQLIQNSVKPNNPSLNPVEYSIPAARFPDNTYIMDSKAIALRLEKDYPSPSLHMDSPILPEIGKIVAGINGPLRGVWIQKVPQNLLNEPSQEYFVRTREKRLGMNLAKVAETTGGEEAWMEALPKIKSLGEVLKKNRGPFIDGETGRSYLLSSLTVGSCSPSSTGESFLAN